jgi:RimJ/RimL family protein N-acetyltransferase
LHHPIRENGAMSFAPIRTDRLLLRRPRPADAAALAERRSDSRVAEFQNWVPPYPLERAEAMLAGLVESTWLANDDWSMLTIADADDRTIYGDLALHPTWDGRSIEIGYSLAPSAWGRGYASEAVGALVERLWSDPNVTRLSAMLHPDNVASEQVLERTGFLFEGRTRLSYWVADDNTDDLLYGMTRAERQDWISRPRHEPDDVRLVDVDADNVHALRLLTTHRSQERFVSPMAVSLADALRPGVRDGAPTLAMPFGIAADRELVGFAMIAAVTGQPRDQKHESKLWRLLIDRRHQRRGIGLRALDALVTECRRMGAHALVLHWCEGRGSPRPFYEQAGFVPTGKVIDGETEARLVIDAF